MDLDELRDALDEAGRAHGRRCRRGARRGRRARRPALGGAAIGLSLVAVAAVVAVADRRDRSPSCSNRNARQDRLHPTDRPAARVRRPRRGRARRWRTTMRWARSSCSVARIRSSRPPGTTRGSGTGTAGHRRSRRLSPPAREGAVMAYDPATKQVVMFGGTRSEPPLRRRSREPIRWTFDGRRWTQQRPTHVPPWSNGVAMSFDPKSKSALLLTLPSHHPNITVAPDGFSGRSPAPFGTWRWTGSDWAELTHTDRATVRHECGARRITAPRLTPLANGAGLLFYSWALPASDLGSCPRPVRRANPSPTRTARITRRPGRGTEPPGPSNIRPERRSRVRSS